MRTILLVGDFKDLRPVLGGLTGFQFRHCHSIDSLRSEWGKASIFAVFIAVRSLSPSVFEFLREAQGRAPGLKWALFVKEVDLELSPFSGKSQVFFQGVIAKDWIPRLSRFLEESRLEHRIKERARCRGGVRVKDSEFAKEPTGQRAFGRIRNLSGHGAALVFEQEPPYAQGAFLEVAFRDLQGAARSFHGQIRWRRRREDGTFEVGLLFLAAA